MSLDDLTFISFDTETTGRYPIESEVCEIAAVKYKNGQIIGTFEALVKPKVPMGEEVIKIHGITNEMVARAPSIAEVIPEFRQFIEDGYMMAHHAAFDMGFMTVPLEEAGLSLPEKPVICTSRLSRNVITDSPNHKLQTLIPHLGLHKGTAHRALDDAKACLELGLACFERAKLTNLDQIFERQEGKLEWRDFSVQDLQFKNKAMGVLIEAMKNRTRVKLFYSGGSKKERVIEPLGLVRSPADGDFFIAYDDGPFPKRFYLTKVSDIQRI